LLTYGTFCNTVFIPYHSFVSVWKIDETVSINGDWKVQIQIQIENTIPYVCFLSLLFWYGYVKVIETAWDWFDL